ncbi:MAG: site-specific integrase [Candidatus Limnocylindrales bacterium]
MRRSASSRRLVTNDSRPAAPPQAPASRSAAPGRLGLSGPRPGVASAIGTPVEPGTILRTWYRVLESAGVGHVRWHDLRHAHATLMLGQGIHPKVVSERLGHASVAITLDTYSHVLPGLQAAAAEALDAVLVAPEPAELAR